MDYTRFFAKRVARRQENLIRKLTEMRSLHPDAISLAGGMPNPSTFPFKSISVIDKDDVSRSLIGPDLNSALQYGPSQGHLPLVKKYREFQQKWHSPPRKDWDVVFMAGSQDGFCKILELLLDEDEPIMAQIPAYTATLGAKRKKKNNNNDHNFEKLFFVKFDRSTKDEDTNSTDKTMDYFKRFSDVSLTRRKMLINILGSAYAEVCTVEDPVGWAEGQKNPATFPIDEIRFRTKDGRWCNLVDDELHAAMKMTRAQGVPALVCKLRAMVKLWHAPPNDGWDVLVLNGSQDAIWRIFQAFLDKGDPVMIQTPVYFGIPGAIRPLVPDFIGIRQDADGIIPEEIEKVCEERIRQKKILPKLLYVNPIGANPTGAVLTTARKLRVYELARKYDFIIIEDDAYYFLHFLEEQPKSFLSMDTDGRVIRLDSFSKIISAGLRLGVVTANTTIIQKLVTHVENSILHSSSLSQMMIYKLFESWSDERFDQHFKDIQQFYKNKRDMMIAAVEKHLTGLAEWSVPKGGMFVWIRLIGIENSLKLAMERCVPNGVFVIPGNAFNYDSSTPDQHLRLCYSFATSEEVDKGLSIIAKLIREEMAEGKNIRNH